MTLERRALTRPLEMRAATAEDAARKVGGYAVVYNSVTVIGDMFQEMFAPGAFTDAIREDVVALFGHDRNRVLGRTAAGTLRLSEDATGVAYEVDLPDTTDGRDLGVSVERGDIRGTSFGFRSVKETWDETTEPPTRTILKAEMSEISPTAFPAYDDTSIALRSLDETRKEQKRKNFNAAAHRLRMKTNLELKLRSKA
jgi:HK97 family phage prohead protease